MERASEPVFKRYGAGGHCTSIPKLPREGAWLLHRLVSHKQLLWFEATKFWWGFLRSNS